MRQVALILSITCMVAIDAYPQARVFQIKELTERNLAKIDIKDGSVEDWLAVIGEPTLTAADFEVDEQWAPYDPADLDFRIWMAWHGATNRIYVAIEKVDDVYVAYADRNMPPDLHPMFPWSSDSTVHFLIDGDHSGGKAISSDGGSPQERSYQDNVGTQYFMVAGDNNLREDGQHISLMQNGFSYRKN